jgi:hypothetical protein
MNPAPLFDWINERHAIYLRRAAGEPRPWTTDPVLNEYKFTNVFRELDRVTVWVREHIREPYADHPDLWLMLVVARYVCVPESLAGLMVPGLWTPGRPDFKTMTAILEARRQAGLQVETGAYMIRAESNRDAEWYAWTKQRYIIERVCGGMWDRREMLLLPALRESIEAATSALMTQYGCGGFMAYEIATDLRHCPGWLDRAPDIMTWANPGPGAMRGLNRLHGRPVRRPRPSLKQAVAEMRELLEMSPLYLAAHVPPLEMRDIEHSLCEMDKWLRVRAGEGRPRSKFVPRTE